MDEQVHVSAEEQEHVRATALEKELEEATAAVEEEEELAAAAATDEAEARQGPEEEAAAASTATPPLGVNDALSMGSSVRLALAALDCMCVSLPSLPPLSTVVMAA
tara:strand:+ start:242 stop:559 length:318 start_codon:yes stop_codon:yes gene_type:complete